ncbi:MAG: Ldh family oxidoreductase [Chloroflexi bacterium]|nr:Ldh family oxidoreductase [Chloroflexota bacterium]
MSHSDTDQRLPIKEAYPFVQRIFEAAGLPEADAAVVTDNLLLADLRGHPSHGISRVRVYCNRIRDGFVATEPAIHVIHETPAAFHLDGGHGMGAAVAAQAMRMCMDKARASGVALCSVRAGTHFGIASYYTMQAASRDMIGFACSNAPATMAPWGGITPLLGTNPFSMSVPAGKHRPLVFDSASSIVARGKINLAEIEDRSIPLGWAIDQQGRPTTDATEALKGSVLPFGEHRGYGIALMIDILSGILSGAAYGPHLGPLWNNSESHQNLGFFLLAIDISTFRDIDDFKGQIDQMIDTIKASKPAPDRDEILVPGEIEFRNEQYNRKHGIVVGPGVLRDLEALRREFELDIKLGTHLRSV